ncbi:hypothetical protein [Streptomyces sp. 147326]
MATGKNTPWRARRLRPVDGEDLDGDATFGTAQIGRDADCR